MDKSILTLIREVQELRTENINLKNKVEKYEARLEYALHFKNFAHKSMSLINFISGSHSQSLADQAETLKVKFQEIKDKRQRIFAKHELKDEQHFLAYELVKEARASGLDPDEIKEALKLSVKHVYDNKPF